MNENKIIKKKIVDPCPNKLFISWMEEITKTAKKNNDQTYFTYKKALKSIKIYPLLLKSGKDCLTLDGFGDKTCALLDNKLYELAKNQGLSISKALKRANKEFSGNSSKTIFLPLQMPESYALMFGLYEIENNFSKVGNVKKEIIRNSIKYYKPTSDSNSLETLWKDMKKLIKNNIVIQDGVRYHMTDNGLSLCAQLIQSGKAKILPVDTLTTSSIISLPTTQLPVKDETFSESLENKTQLEGLQFFYCKSLIPNVDDLVNMKSQAAYKIKDEEKYYRIKVNLEDLCGCELDYFYDLDALNLNDGLGYVFLRDRDAPFQGCYVKEDNKISTVLNANPVIKKLDQMICNDNNIDSTISKLKKLTKRKLESEINHSPVKHKIVNCNNNALPDALKNKFVQSQSKEQLNCGDNSNIFYTMTRGTFKVILIVDNRENFGIGKFRDHLCPDLIKKGVELETRVLSTGDFAWIARDNIGREAVLDIIVERKTYGDLAQSIVDKRFKDQKLRMKRSGISKIIYLLEKGKGMRNLSLPIDNLHQTLINSQINDNCDIKITENGAETISYLSYLTKKLCKYYSDKSLDVFKDYIPEERKCFNPFDRNAIRFSGIDYNSFMQSGQKTKPLRISEMFAKHVNCISGITIERSKAIIDKYPVPRSLIEAYSKCGSEKDCIAMLSNVKLISNQSFGLANSRSLYAAYSRK